MKKAEHGGVYPLPGDFLDRDAVIRELYRDLERAGFGTSGSDIYYNHNRAGTQAVMSGSFIVCFDCEELEGFLSNWETPEGLVENVLARAR